MATFVGATIPASRQKEKQNCLGLGEGRLMYSDKVIDHYENPRNVGKMDREDKDVGTGMVGAPAVAMSCNSR